MHITEDILNLIVITTYGWDHQTLLIEQEYKINS